MSEANLNPATIKKLNELVSDGKKLEHEAELDRWAMRAQSFLELAWNQHEAEVFGNLEMENPWDTLALRIGRLEGLTALAEQAATIETRPSTDGPLSPEARKVFVVHGHDDAAKNGVARFIEKMKLHPIILHEQPNGGRTIIEKFETYSGDVAFAVILLTPDDLAVAAGGVIEISKLRPRARQNVIMELGYFMGRLGRDRVCALHKGDVELPSDYQGVIYVAMDDAGAWRTKLAQELVQAKIRIDLEGLLGG
jgi:predicted nucleotide-binding protein